jgi:hypothetical protein
MKKYFVSVLLGLLVVTQSVWAADFLAPKQGEDPNITVSASEVKNNLYAVGANVTVNGSVKGDLMSAGGMVTVIGDVEADLNVAGGSLALSGKVGGDARIVGGNLTISSPIGGDLLVAGGNVSLTEKASVGGDLIIAGGNVILEAPVAGKVRAMAGNLTINSKIGKDVNVRISGNKKNEGNLIFGPKAEVMGQVYYKGVKSAVVKEGAKVSDIEFTPVVKVNTRAWLGMGVAIKFLAILLTVLVLVRWQKEKYQQLATGISEKFWENLGIGLVGVIATPIIGILLLVTFVGFYIGIILLLWYVLVLLMAYLLAVIVLGLWLMKTLKVRADYTILDWKTALLGSVGMLVLGFIPVVGWLVCLVIFLASVGGILKVGKQKWGMKNISNI